MTTAILLVIVEVGALLGYALLLTRKGGAGGSALEKFQAEIDSRQKLRSDILLLLGGMTDLATLRERGGQLATARENLKTERGRATITEAELETVETRLRELEEIERELQASEIDAQDEINILQRKERDLKARNETLRSQLGNSVSQIDSLMGELALSAQVAEEVNKVKQDMLKTQEQIDGLILKIEEGNAAYLQMKKCYDALDIEYAQLYEKFAAMEEAAKS